MKMNYRLIRNRRVGAAARTGAVLFICAALLFAFQEWRPRALRDALQRAAVPFWRAESGVRTGAARLFAHLSSKETLIRENEMLRDRTAKDESQLLSLALLEEENASLRGLLDGRPRVGRALAAVLAAPPRSPYDTLLLDVGVRDGVGVGDAVLLGGAVLGRVAEVFSHTSLAELHSTAGVETPVFLMHDGKPIAASLAGAGGGAFSARLPRDVVLAEGDRAILPGSSPTLVARVAAIERDSSGLFQTVHLTSPLSLRGMRFVEVRTDTEATRNAANTEQTRNNFH